MSEYKHLKLHHEGAVSIVELNRPDKANALNAAMWIEIGEAFQEVDALESCRAVILKGAGKNFCAGIDLMDLASVLNSKEKCEGRKREKLRALILKMQGSFNDIERCRKPVLAAIHGACVGGAIDMTTACDMRYAAEGSHFDIREINVGMTADVGTLQRLPHLIPDGIMRELAYTGRKMEAEEAARIGLINKVYESEEALFEGVMSIAQDIASKSPLAIRGTKEMILYTRDHSVADSLNYVATWNAGMLLSADIMEAMAANMQKREPVFKD